MIILSYVVIVTKIRRMKIHVHLVEKNRIKYSVSKGYSDFCTIS